MNKYILVCLLVASTVYAQELDPFSPVARIEGTAVVQSANVLPNLYGRTTDYRQAKHLWAQDGWVQADLSFPVELVTNAIPSNIQSVASAYKDIVDGYFGPGSVTNTAITRDYVSITLSLDTNVTADTGVRLRAYYEILSGYWGGAANTLHDFPWDQSEYVVEIPKTLYNPWLFATADDIKFESVLVGDNSQTSFQLVNARLDGDITGTISVSGPPFSLNTPSSFTLTPGSSQTVVLQYTPTLEESSFGSVVINSDAGTYTNDLTGVTLVE